MNIFSRLKEGLSKTRTQIQSILGIAVVCDAAFFENMQDALIAADVGVDLAGEIIEQFKQKVRSAGPKSVDEANLLLKEILVSYFVTNPQPPLVAAGPHVILVTGVNGVGKTTTIGKMAAEFNAQGKKVMLGAADTFRAGATQQLRIWAERTGSDIVAQAEGADPASVVFDALEAGKNRGSEIVILDTAGRLQNKVNLMNELEKIVRVAKKSMPDAPHQTLLVIDATTGQNALNQATVFHELIGITGFVITKLDGTAKGGIIIALSKKFGLPILKVGVGEGIDDLQDFDPRAFVNAMF